MKPLLRYLYVIYAAILFVALFLIVFPFIVIFGLLGARGRKASWILVRGWAYIWFWLTGLRAENIYEARPIKGRVYIVVANHISYLDTPLIFRSIPFFVRPLATHEYARIPLFGKLYKTLAVIIDRSNNASKASGFKILQATLKEGSSIFIFPEGRFNTSGALLHAFYDGAFRMAVQTQTPILPLLFLDTHARWHYASFWAFNPGRCRVVYLPAVHPGECNDDAKIMKERVFAAMEQTMLQYKALAKT